MRQLQTLDGLVVLDATEDRHLYDLVVEKTRSLRHQAPGSLDHNASNTFYNALRSIQNSVSAAKTWARHDPAVAANLDAAWQDWQSRFYGAFKKHGNPKANLDLDDSPHDPRPYLVAMLHESANEIRTHMYTSRELERAPDIVAGLLARTPELFLERMRLSLPDERCPPRFRLQFWGRQELPDALRYGPAITLPPRLSQSTEAPRELLQPLLELLLAQSFASSPIDHGTRYYSEIGSALVERNKANLAWLSTNAVNEWYDSLFDGEAEAFAALIRHLTDEAKRIETSSGCFLVSNSLAHLSPDLVAEWMSTKWIHEELATPFPYCRADLELRHPAAPVPHEFVRFLPPDHPHRLRVDRSLGFRKARIYARRRGL